MPTQYSRYLIGKERTIHADKKLGWTLAFVAGAINAGGFLAVNQYTSHMTGMISSVADDIVPVMCDVYWFPNHKIYSLPNKMFFFATVVNS